jgi:hypothetical protein
MYLRLDGRKVELVHGYETRLLHAIIKVRASFVQVREAEAYDMAGVSLDRADGDPQYLSTSVPRCLPHVPRLKKIGLNVRLACSPQRRQLLL